MSHALFLPCGDYGQAAPAIGTISAMREEQPPPNTRTAASFPAAGAGHGLVLSLDTSASDSCCEALFLCPKAAHFPSGVSVCLQGHLKGEALKCRADQHAPSAAGQH